MDARARTLTEGTELPARTIEVTPLLVCGGALFSRDYYPVHHSHRAAVEAGAEGVFLNIMTSCGLVSSYAKAQAGSDFRLAGVQLRLGRPCVAGEQLRLTGTVAASDGDGDGDGMPTAVELDVRAALSGGAEHLRASLRLERTTDDGERPRWQ